MPDLADGESTQMQGSSATPYTLKNVGGVYSCTCPAWRNQSTTIEKRTCKHLRKLRGDAAENARIGSAAPAPARANSPAAAKAAGPPLLLAESWDCVTDPTGWWLSEKLDGVRAYWDGKQFLSRLGNPFHAPDWFIAQLPDVALDGELWIDRKKFQRTVSIVRRQDKSDHWKEVSFVVFDAPGLDKTFEQRQQFIVDCVQPLKASHLRPHEQQRCQGIGHLRQELTRLEALGAEGLMMRRAGSRYEVGRSSTLLKVKTFHDAEAKVIKHLEGAGKHKGRLGALMVELPDGTRFSVGTGFSDAERQAPPALGSFITFRYQELSDAGVPRFPSYVGVRDDAAAAPAPQTKPAAVTAPVAMPAAKPQLADGMTRRFILPQGKSAKFWEVEVTGSLVKFRAGSGKSAGKETTQSFADATAAGKYAEQMVKVKTGQGYFEIARY